MSWIPILVLPPLYLALILYIYLKPADPKIFKKFGIESPPAKPVFGHLGYAIRYGLTGYLSMYYNIYRGKKVYGLFEGPMPALYIRDLDILKEVFVKSFDKFYDRRHLIKFDAPFHDNLLMLKGERWKHVRSTVTPVFSSSHIKQMAKHVERTTKYLLKNLQEKQAKNEEMNLKDVAASFALDVIAGTGFGIDLDSFNDPNNTFVVKAKKSNQLKTLPAFLMVLFPKLTGALSLLGLNIMDMESVRYMVRSVDTILQERQTSGEMSRHDFLDLLIHAKNDARKSAWSMLTTSEVHGVALNFIIAGFDTVSSVISFTLFMLAHHPQQLQTAQAEIDSKIGSAKITYENVQQLHYLDMCINETMRLFPGGLIIDRQCMKTTTVKGVTIPEGMGVVVPVYAIHHDPDIWPEPEKFKPERFTPDSVAARHPFAFIPFGHGPRRCIGNRLGFLETAMAVASVLQEFTPVPCSKSVYPVILENALFPKAKHGLWVRFELYSGFDCVD